MLLLALALACADKGGAKADDTAGEAPAGEESCESTWYLDEDGDGFGRETGAQEACEAPAGHAAQAGDCDDGDPAISPAAEEVCDEADNDCDGQADEGVLSTLYADPDGDGYGDSAAPVEGCAAGAGYAAEGGDCDSDDPSAWPGAEEVCDEVDQDCDGAVDEGVESTFYLDDDGDGHGEPGDASQACERPAGYALLPGDCDDANPSVSPSSPEVCDDIDDDCDGMVDEDDYDLAGAPMWFLDADGDGYGTYAAVWEACEQPDPSYIAVPDDCDDADAGVNPGQPEAPDGIDNDCDGLADEGL